MPSLHLHIRDHVRDKEGTGATVALLGDSIRSIACILLPHFMWQVETRRREGLQTKKENLLIVQERAVLDWSPGLEGVSRGMPVDQALSRHPTALVADADIAACRSAFSEILDGLDARIPEVEDGGLGAAYVNIAGAERLYGNDARVVTALGSVAPIFDLRVGVGPNKWLAFVAASISKPHSARKVVGEPGRFLSAFPVSLLLDRQPGLYWLVQRLQTFGLDTLGDVAAISVSAMQGQFGPDGILVWELANGKDDSPLIPISNPSEVSEYLSFPAATVSMPVILAALDNLVARAYRRPELAGMCAKDATLGARVFQRTPWSVHLAFKEPARKDRAFLAIKAKLDTVSPWPGPIEDLRLTFGGLTGESGRQESLWADLRREAGLTEAMGQMQAWLGHTPPVYRVVEVEPWSRVPERRHALLPFSP